MRDRYRIDAAGKVLDILEFLSEHRGAFGLPELSRSVGIPKPTLFRYMVTLEERGYVTKNSDSKYTLGLRILQLSNSALGHMTIHEVALPHMRELLERFQETVNLAVLEGHEIVYIEILESPRAFKMSSHVGGREIPHSTSLGKAILAYLPEAQMERIIRTTGLPRYTANTICSLPRFREELAAVRERGYAIDNEENQEGARCVGVPVFDRRGCPIAAISISGPALRFSNKEEEEMGRALLEVSAKISRQIGHVARGRSRVV
ncbi:MAG: IclR family transcriptional regulator [Anaerolineae bacterium]